ncbi:hypothetical protein Cgig2_018475 [Carnegiea gigantea]|uniref:Uncharacterized protein n=1 Tax=Carnegiea gigantea TaxID=171969 RepID=A0A9Q1GU15_9CARY|nr:hypothetical protein Cgig2_018475 [Carnegiea gigantea]
MMASCRFIMKRAAGKQQGVGSSRSGGGQQGSLIDEEWGMPSGSEYVPSETGSSTEDTVSMVDESCEAVGGFSNESDDAEERELTAALVKAWVPRRKAFRLTGRLVLFSVYDVALFTGLPMIGKVFEFGEDDLSTTELARMVRLRIAQYVTEKSDNLKSKKGRKRPVFRHYIKVMKKLLDANKELEKLGLWLSLYAWRVMSGVMFPRTPYGAAWSVQKYIEDVWLYEHTTRFTQRDKCRFPRLASWDSVNHGGRYGAFLLVEGIKESEKSRAHELEARLKRCTAPAAPQDTPHQPGGDVGVDIQSGLDSMAGAVTNVGEATVYKISSVKVADEDTTCQTTANILGAICDDQSTSQRTAEAVTPVDGCDDVGMPPV